MFLKTKMVFIRTFYVYVFIMTTGIQLSSSTKADADINQALMEKLRVLEEKFAKLENDCKQSTLRIEEMSKSVNSRRLLLPNSDTTQTVAFSAYLSKSFDGSTFGTLREIVYDKLESNIGHAYNNYTGTFVAPISGVYAFTWSIYVAGKPDGSGNQGEIAIELVVNAKVVGLTHADTESVNDDDSATGFVIKSLSAGDSVLMRSSNVFRPEGHIMSGNGRARWTFSGWLIA
ncbi:complement C1q tumor necrosis factor-related protein 3-like [Mytilus californianus]|uniref:complement C1q tumor necrosis factor-related protein 3-like n=1 Tax=Mytilus californianus TaxID=6549 RepID=UPI002246E766|nr:complement C1q tumor necrosis factor-related protein 3-like [Mytilus californianus]